MKARKHQVSKAASFAPAIKVARNQRILRELPEGLERRLSSIFARNELLRATEAQNLKIERDRVNAHLHSMPEGLQRLAALEHVGALDRRIHKLAGKGLPR